MEFFVIGGEFTSLNFHSFTPGSSNILGPFPNRTAAEEAWEDVSKLYSHMAGYRFIIVEARL